MWTQLWLCIVISDFATLWSSALVSCLNKRLFTYQGAQRVSGSWLGKRALASAVAHTVASEAHCLPLWFLFQSDPTFVNNILLRKVLSTYLSGENSTIDSFPWRTPLSPPASTFADSGPESHFIYSHISYPPHPELFLYESVKEDSLNKKGILFTIITTKTVIIKCP